MHPVPIINLRMFRIRNFAVVTLISLVFGISMLGGFAFLPVYFQDIRGNSAIISGLKLFPMVVGIMIGSMSSGIYVSKTGNFIYIPKIGMGLMAIGQGLLSLMNETMSFGIEWIFLFILGIGMGMCFPVFNSVVQNSVPPEDMASSVAAVTFVRSIGGSVGVAIFGAILTSQVTYYAKHGQNPLEAETHGLQYLFLCTMIPGLMAFAFTFFARSS